jgi:hypothetical protein
LAALQLYKVRGKNTTAVESSYYYYDRCIMRCMLLYGSRIEDRRPTWSGTAGGQPVRQSMHAAEGSDDGRGRNSWSSSMTMGILVVRTRAITGKHDPSLSGCSVA